MKSRLLILAFIVFDVVLSLYLLLHASNIQLFNSKGVIAASERNVIIFFLSLMLGVGLPIIAFIFYTAWKYREGNSEDYDPESKHKVLPEFSWWAIPSVLVIILSFVTWNATHALDPYKPISSNTKPITIQVIALRWKWLFIYPEQNIATINFIEFPVNTPVNFELTADAPMSSFWIPQLSGQIYAMSGMATQLHLLASVAGDYGGSPAEINGAGFAGMRFAVKVRSQTEFDSWVSSVKNSDKILDDAEYERLAEPSEDSPTTFYTLKDSHLYNKTIEKFMAPTGTLMQMKGMEN